MEEVKRKIEITQGEYEDLIEALHRMVTFAEEQGRCSISERYAVLMARIDDQIGEQGGFEE